MTREATTRVVIVDDQMLVRQGVRGLLELVPGIEVVGEAADGASAIELVEAVSPDVMLLDVRMPRGDGIDVLRELARRGKQPPTLVLTTFDDSDAAMAAIRAGARGFMLKDVSLTELADAIRAVASGETSFQPALTKSLVSALRRDVPAGEKPEALTARELEVLHLICGGYSNREIAEMLDLAEGTVKNHVSNILLKLDARDRTRAALKAFENGYFTRGSGTEGVAR